MRYKLIGITKNKNDMIIDGESEDSIIHIIVNEKEQLIWIGKYNKNDLGC